MNNELSFIMAQLQDAYAGDPWFGKSVQSLLSEVDKPTAFTRLNGQHSMLELLWHMVNWRQFAIHCLQPSPGLTLEHFEKRDWQDLDHSNEALWPEGLQKLEETQAELIRLLQQQEDALLEQTVKERQYNFRKLLHGLIQHDIYHLGQIAYIHKQLKNRHQ